MTKLMGYADRCGMLASAHCLPLPVLLALGGDFPLAYQCPIIAVNLAKEDLQHGR